ncbi:HTH-type transcriptional regulator / antitoxin HigA [Pedobacter westerhofensis]|uniref:HTH-type transcriptional regulator / antitoxin HigA n=1 Tax=Pedobacter westerhofensis TaxID=425512 RepID=A0A521FGN8_9SPHI|nr:helix-turn-helix domain-containing protein [Pedobacter westerhofensis]SMO95343.1 HTH-type transcriptional regulator / antitoxin HigA [Pedobacter westerhofensis]
MEKLKYTLIKNQKQYFDYCNALESLVDVKDKTVAIDDEIDLLSLLIEKYDEEHNNFDALDPISLLRSLMTDHHLTATALADMLQVSKGYVSDILNYKKGLSKDMIRKLAEYFKLRQDAFNRPYPLNNVMKQSLMNAG